MNIKAKHGIHVGVFGCRPSLGALAQASASDPKCSTSNALMQAGFPCHDPNTPTVHQNKLDMAHILCDHDNLQMILSPFIKDRVACLVQPNKHAY
jgi:hypothetical protein